VLTGTGSYCVETTSGVEIYIGYIRGTHLRGSHSFVSVAAREELSEKIKDLANGSRSLSISEMSVVRASVSRMPSPDFGDCHPHHIFADPHFGKNLVGWAANFESEW